MKKFKKWFEAYLVRSLDGLLLELILVLLVCLVAVAFKACDKPHTRPIPQAVELKAQPDGSQGSAK